MPLMTDMSDPANWAERGKVISNILSNFILSGPRNIRQGLGKLRLAKGRTAPVDGDRFGGHVIGLVFSRD